MPDMESLKWFATLGVGGILAAFMFVFYRRDMRTYVELWKGQSEILMAVVKENTAAFTAHQEAQRGHQEALRALVRRIEQIEDRREERRPT